MSDLLRLAALLLQIFSLTRFIILVVVVGCAALTLTDQGRDLLITADRSVGIVSIALLLAALQLFGVSAWYWGQKSLVPFGARLEGLMPRAPALRRWSQDIQDWYPRVLGTAPLWFIGAFALWHGRMRLATACLIAATLLTAFFWLRRRLLAQMTSGGVEFERPSEERAAELKVFLRDPAFRGPRRTLGASLAAAAFVALFIVPYFSPALPQFLGAPTIAFLWAALVIPLGASLTIVGAAYRLPVLSVTAIVLTLLVASLPELYELRKLPPSNAALAETTGPRDCALPGYADPDDRLSRYACTWLVHRVAAMARVDKIPDRIPVVLVSAEGGGSRAALWTALVLGRLQERFPTFHDAIFAMSGASGGSLGVAVYGSLVADHVDTAGDAPLTQIIRPSREMLARDFLSPALASFVFTDLVRPFAGWLPWTSNDRAATLERSWEDAYGATRGCSASSDEERARCTPLARAYDDMWAGKHAYRVPLLFLNSTQVHDGRRALLYPTAVYGQPAQRVKPIQTFEQAIDLAKELGAPIRLSTAVGLSARFPYVTPVGNIVRGPHVLQFADGGYFDNSATVTIREVAQALPVAVIYRPAGEPARSIRVTPLVLHIVNDPSPETTPDVQGIFKSWQAAAPVRTLLSTRSARSYYARVVLHDWLESNGGIFREIQLPEDKELEVPLGWTLSQRVVEAMEKRSAELQPDVIRCVDWALGNREADCGRTRPKREE
jgi:hypothetical protein